MYDWASGPSGWLEPAPVRFIRLSLPAFRDSVGPIRAFLPMNLNLTSLKATPAPDDRSPGREKDDEDDPEENQEKEKAPAKKKSRTENISLDRYCTKFTSEDNDSFQKVHKFTEEKKKEQYAFLYAAQEQGDRMCEDKDANKLIGISLPNFSFNVLIPYLSTGEDSCY